MSKSAISPTRNEDFPQWYQQVVKQADLAENSPVRGCMVIKPYGYAIWESMQAELDSIFKGQGHKNAYFPLLIPVKNLEKEAEHVAGFAKECAVVTHQRLVESNGKLIPDGQLEEPYVIRPTSETIIGDCFSKWISSYRDLPLKINQWANVMRWEMRTRLFLRTSEFLWQEGHTVHESAQDAEDMTKQMINTYQDFCHDFLALPVILGEKTKAERFPGAVNTYCIEAMMQDGKALQAGTSHFLGQAFAKASNIMFDNRDGVRQHAWTTSWGVSTRLIGAMIMAHSDDDGLVLPATVAPEQVIIIPIIKSGAEEVLAACDALAQKLKSCTWRDMPIRVHVDNRDAISGKHWHWIKKGAPLIVEIGPRDLADSSVMLYRRDTKQKSKLAINNLPDDLVSILTDLQNNIFDKAKNLQEQRTFELSNWDPVSVTEPGFYLAYANDSEQMEKAIFETGLTARCILEADAPGTCIFTGNKTKSQIIFAKAY